MYRRLIYAIAIIIILSIYGCDYVNEIDHGMEGFIEQNNSFPTPNKDEAVDLGLSVKWAPYNVGASQAYEYGNYYAWGEVDHKLDYSYENYNQPDSLNMYGNIINTAYDVANVKWGNGWRLPSNEEIEELARYCSWEETQLNGVRGMKIIGQNGNSIFLPAAGACYNKQFVGNGNYGCYLSGSDYEPYVSYFESYFDKSVGFSVRPVIDYDNIIRITDVQLYHEQTHCGYESYSGNFYTYFYFNVVTESEISLENSNMLDYGIVIYRDGEIFNEVSGSFYDHNIESKFEADEESMNFSYENGWYSATTKGHWKIGTYVVKNTSRGPERIYSEDLIDLDFRYERQPSMTIKNVNTDNFTYSSSEWESVYDDNTGEYSFDVVVEGSLFMRNGYEVLVEHADTSANAVLSYNIMKPVNIDNYIDKDIWPYDGIYKFTNKMILFKNSAYDSVQVATIKLRNVVPTETRAENVILSNTLEFQFYQGKFNISLYDNESGGGSGESE